MDSNKVILHCYPALINKQATIEKLIRDVPANLCLYDYFVQKETINTIFVLLLIIYLGYVPHSLRLLINSRKNRSF
ncbi:hypothetical protein [Coxiella endosymbiont of Dermacentor marginatus]|uniref:hypothetical protein n=1 Tax=Coxiella endosymbiont of Dermacentor marginatus TaxID=1656159 RepID=UPI00222146D0|nr:hypothetical protein [Coxiella endosymbiont of Dermacentor marginatus]